PSAIKAIIVSDYHIEWLDMAEPEHDIYSKNHMVPSVVFTMPKVFDKKKYSSAKISMELGTEKKVGWTPGDQYFPGTYTVILPTYAMTTHCMVHCHTYPIHQGTTIGNLIDKIIDNKMHHFLFLPYTIGGHWKGCGDHTYVLHSI
ncbi:hypothetical protein BS47DRAFT_1244696, partial [Hydnum rufescens UP504]